MRLDTEILKYPLWGAVIAPPLFGVLRGAVEYYSTMDSFAAIDAAKDFIFSTQSIEAVLIGAVGGVGVKAAFYNERPIDRILREQ